MRLPYIPQDPTFTDPSDKEILERVKQRRGGKLIALDQALLHAPPVAGGWNSFLGAVRTQTSLPTSIRELAICRVAALNRAWFEWDHHVPILEEAGVLGKEAVASLRDGERRTRDQEGLFDDKHWAVLQYTDAMTKDVIVKDEVFAELKKMFSEREVVEITATVAAYNCVSRFLVALDVGEMSQKYGVDMK